MKYLVTLVMLLILNTPGYSQVTKKALLVGVGKYPEGGRWKNLSSANDIRYLREALQKQGFDEKNIVVLADAQATKDNILSALRNLEKQSTADDIIFFHFSGHGQQIQDDKANPDETDGYDEALIPYDAKAAFDPVTYKGEKHLRDDELQPILANIRRNIGQKGSLVVSLDACHSGTATRSNEFSISRGDPMPFKNPSYIPSSVHKIGNTGEEGFADGGRTAGNMIVFSASSPSQVNYETKDADKKGVGSLSLALAKALAELPENSNYEMLFQKIKADIQSNYPMQIPMMEGNGKQRIFNGDYTTFEDILEIKWINDSTVSIPAGFLHGISGGSVFQLIPIGKETAAAKGNVIKVGNFESIGRIDKKLDKKQGYEVKWESVSFGAFSATVFLNDARKKKTASNVQAQLKDLISNQSYLKLNNDADFMVDIADSSLGTVVTLIEKGDSIRWMTIMNRSDTLTDLMKKDLLSKLRSTMKVKFMRSLDDGGILTEDVKVEIIPKRASTNPNEMFVKPGDEFSIRITNNGPQTLYYTIINIMPDNLAKVLIPEENATTQEYVLKRGSKPYLIEGFTVDSGTPKGKELFKVLFSVDPMDLRGVFQGTTTRGPGDMLSFETVVKELIETSNGTTTRSGFSNVKVGEVGILTVGFTVENK